VGCRVAEEKRCAYLLLSVRPYDINLNSAIAISIGCSALHSSARADFLLRSHLQLHNTMAAPAIRKYACAPKTSRRLVIILAFLSSLSSTRFASAHPLLFGPEKQITQPPYFFASCFVFSSSSSRHRAGTVSSTNFSIRA
jgi:hypothetical protein